jgi:YggT family protein
VIAEAVYTATDPPLRFLRRYIPSPRIGSVSLDLSFMLLFLVIIVLLQVL